MNVINRNSATHYVWGQGCDGWHLVKSDGLSVIEERMPAKTQEVAHYHRESRQFFYVLEGSLTMEVGGEAKVVVAGAGMEIAPGVVHQVRNESGGEVRFLVISQPPSHGDRVEAR